jgi:hypothetical protein
VDVGSKPACQRATFWASFFAVLWRWICDFKN